MWLPVVDDSTLSKTCSVEEHVIEAIVEVVPETVLSHARVDFVWIRGFPTDPLPDNLVAALRSEADVEDRLAAVIRDDKGVVLEIYVENVESGLTDEWLEREWGIRPNSLNLSTTEKLEITFFALLTHVAIRQGQVDEAKTLVRRIGRVIFRAAVRAALKNLKEAYPDMTVDRVAPSLPEALGTSQGPIDAREAARVDYDQLFRQLLGLEPTGDGADKPEPPTDGGV